LDKNFLMGEQENPRNILAAKRLMMDFVPMTSATRHKLQAHMLLLWRAVSWSVHEVQECVEGGTQESIVGIQKRTLPAEAGRHQHNQYKGDDHRRQEEHAQKGSTFIAVKDNGDKEEEEDLLLSTYKQHLH
jgi:hypothetical protein